MRGRTACWALVLSITLVACDSTSPSTPVPVDVRGTVRVTISTTGNARDPDGYVLLLDSIPFPLRGDTTVVLSQVYVGLRTLSLTRVAPHCAVAGANQQSLIVTTGATSQASFSIRCLGRFAYSNGDLRYVDEDGVDRALTPIYDRLTTFQWSPDGSRLAFVAGPVGHTHIYVVRADGSGLQQLTNGARGEGMPVWSPTGDRIAFTAPADTVLLTGLFVMNADGSNQRQLLPADSHYDDPQWMKDGRRLVVHFITGLDLSYGLYQVDVQAGTRQAIAAAAGGFEPAVSPDGRRLAFELMQGNRQTIVVLPDGGSAPIPVTTGAGADCLGAVWAPDGESLLHTCVVGSSFLLYRSKADGSGTVKLSGGPGSDEFPSISPDGRWILMQSTRSTSYFRPYAMNADGSEAAPVVVAGGYTPSWRP